MSKLHPVVRAILSVVGTFLIILAIRFLKSLIVGGDFEPRWLEDTVISVFAGLISFFGPNAAQRRKNREDLARRFRK